MRFKALLAAGLLLLTACNALAAEQVLRLGLFPGLIPRTLISMYEPLRQHLESTLGQPVQLFSSPDFSSFAQRTAQSDYEVILTAPHLAYLAVHENDYSPVASYKTGIKTILLVRTQDAALPISAFRGKSVAIPDPHALVTYVGDEMLRERGLLAEQDYMLLRSRGHQGAAMAVVQGEAAMAFMGGFPYNQLSDDIKRRVSIYAESPVYPAQYFLVSNRLDTAKRKQIQQALLDFAKTGAGQRLIEQSQFGGIVAAKGQDLNRMRGIAGRVKQQLAKTATDSQ